MPLAGFENGESNLTIREALNHGLQRVATAYDSTAAYVVGDRVHNNGHVYECIQDVSPPHTLIEEDQQGSPYWRKIVSIHEIPYDKTAAYMAGDQVLRGKVVYVANGNIPADTDFVIDQTGADGATWRAIAGAIAVPTSPIVTVTDADLDENSEYVITADMCPANFEFEVTTTPFNVRYQLTSVEEDSSVWFRAVNTKEDTLVNFDLSSFSVIGGDLVGTTFQLYYGESAVFQLNGTAHGITVDAHRNIVETGDWNLNANYREGQFATFRGIPLKSLEDQEHRTSSSKYLPDGDKWGLLPSGDIFTRFRNNKFGSNVTGTARYESPVYPNATMENIVSSLTEQHPSALGLRHNDNSGGIIFHGEIEMFPERRVKLKMTLNYNPDSPADRTAYFGLYSTGDASGSLENAAVYFKYTVQTGILEQVQLDGMDANTINVTVSSYPIDRYKMSVVSAEFNDAAVATDRNPFANMSGTIARSTTPNTSDPLDYPGLIIFDMSLTDIGDPVILSEE